MRTHRIRLTLLFGLAATLLAGCQRNETAVPVTEEEQAGQAQQETRTAWVDAQRLRNADAEPGNWLAHGRTSAEQRYSPLDEITAQNVGTLGLAWHANLDTARGQEATPIVVDGVLYSTSAWSKVQAVDAQTGRMLWQYNPEVAGIWDVRACCGVQNRGPAVWKGKVYVGALDGRLIALDAESGELQWEINTTDQAQSYTITGAPRMAGDRIIIGNGGAEYGVRGYVSAYDPETGDLLWRFYTVPGNPAEGFEDATQEMAARTWTGEWWTNGGGGTAWDSFAYDAELNLVYIGTGNGSPWTRSIRSPGGGDNLFLASIVAVHAGTGEYAWHYQTVPGDTWDYTAVQHMVLADLEIGGSERKVIMQAPKNGFFYVIDRASGELISARNIVPTSWATHIDMATGRPVETPDARYDETLAAKIMAPGPGGAHNWQPMTYSPDTGLVYIPAKQTPFTYQLNENFIPGPIGFNHGVNTWETPAEVIPLGPEFGEEYQGFLLAWNPVTQEEAWRVPHRNFENGGLLSTAGNLVFQGNADEQMVAYNATTGERLWSAPTQTGVLAPPVSYTVDGEQYVAVVAGWGAVSALTSGALLNPDGKRRNVSRILAFKLGAKGVLPDLPPLPARLPPPGDFGSEAQIAAGSSLYRRYCLICHGAGAVAGGVVPDLRHSAMAGSAEAFSGVVLGGALLDKGMASFAEVFDEEDAEAVRAYVVHEANQ